MGFFEVNKIPLKVLISDGFDTKTGTNINETQLLYDDSELNTPTFYFNSGFDGSEFEISILVKEEYYFKERHISDYLNQYDKWNTVVSVVTNAMDVPNGKYTMQIKGKKQTSFQESIWKLRFKQYYENSLSFESMYTVKTGSLSSLDQTLVKYHEIDYYSTKEAILALQKKLQQKGCWSDTVKELRNGIWYDVIIDTDDGPDFKKRVPNGVWDDQMQGDIFGFQVMHNLSPSKQGKCDLETIQTLLGDVYYGTGFYDQYQGY